MTALAGQSLQPDEAGLSKLFLAHNQVSPRFGPTQRIPIFLGGRPARQEGGAHMPFVGVTKLRRPPALGVCEESVGEPQQVIQFFCPSQRKQLLTGPLTIPERGWRDLDFLNAA